MLRRVLKPVALGATSAVAVGAAALVVDAPMGDMGDGKYTIEHETKFPEWAHNMGRVPVFLAATTAAKVYLKRLNSFSVEGTEILVKQVEERPKGTALITVSNHSATVDDPAVIAAMLPWSYGVMPHAGRWSLCSQEYSYTKGRAISAIFYGAKTLPVKRGAGVDHPMMKAIFDKVELGEWVHIFPEGKIVQNEMLGGRESPRREEIGRLKWGVGKLIARASVRPVVVPFYHHNMEKVMPQNEKNQLISVVPKTNVDIRVRVGEPISFDDLFDAYEKSRVVGATPWQTQEREKALFQAITKRIEDALLELAEPSKQQQHQ
uniref:Tafazzin family protein n=1 Tax=Globisporangium ultimum (strain ATCC 200006 / CBS 805.95 / DAOM BR144) TaxID=431595 RepID=K3WZT1_GLOUD